MRNSRVLWLSAVLLSPTCEGAGMTAHNIAAKRASQYEYFGPKTDQFNPEAFYNLAFERSDAIQAGSPFPDFLYACGDEHDAGEEAHWTPFQIASVNYIRDKYPDWSEQPRSNDGPGLVAFTMGITSHYIADINWHGLEVIPSGEGMIRTMGYADFNCTHGDLCSIAHSAADTGGEFVAAASLELKSWFPAEKWFVPTEDLVNIYAAMNATGDGPLVEAQWINECAVLFYAGCFGVSRFGDLIYPFLAPQLGGVLLEQFFDFPVGGIDDDAAWTSFMWNRLAGWLVYGPPPDDPPPNWVRYQEMLKQVSKESVQVLSREKWRHRELQAKRSYVSAIKNILKQHSPLFEYKKTATGSATVGLVPGAGEATLPRDVLLALAEALLNDYVLVLYPDLSGTQSALFDKMTHRVKHLNDAESPSALSEDVKATTTVVAQGAAEHEYFASSLTLMGGGRDLLVGSPGSGVAGGPQQGSATLFFDVANPSKKNNTLSSVRFNGGAGAPSPSYERFGWSSTACDVNRDGVEDAVVCAPSYLGGSDTEAARGSYMGRCDVFYGPFSSSEEPAVAFSLFGDKEWGNFGYAVTSGDVDGDGFCDVVVSAPFAGSYEDIAPSAEGAVSSQGAVYVFLSATLNTSPSQSGLTASESADLILQPQTDYQWFGKSVQIAQVNDRQLLLVGAPVFHSALPGEESSAVGRVYGYDFRDLLGSQGAQQQLFTLTGCSHAGGTGHTLASSSSYLAFSETGWNSSSVLRSGKVHWVQWSALLDHVAGGGRDVAVCDLSKVLGASTMSLEGQIFEGRFGSTLAFSGEQSLLVASPMADDGRGRVSRVDLSSGAEEVLHESSLSNKQLGKCRAGQSLAVAQNGNGLVFVGSPYATSTAGEQCGALLRY